MKEFNPLDGEILLAFLSFFEIDTLIPVKHFEKVMTEFFPERFPLDIYKVSDRLEDAILALKIGGGITTLNDKIVIMPINKSTYVENLKGKFDPELNGKIKKAYDNYFERAANES